MKDIKKLESEIIKAGNNLGLNASNDKLHIIFLAKDEIYFQQHPQEKRREEKPSERKIKETKLFKNIMEYYTRTGKVCPEKFISAEVETINEQFKEML